MFERFTSAARQVVVQAQTEARELDHGWIGTEHLLLAVLSGVDGPLVAALTKAVLTHDGVRREVLRWFADGHDDATALRGLGIDLDDVRRRVEDTFGPGALDDGEGTAPGSSRWRRPRRGSGEGGGHIPFSRDAKKALELSLREAVTLHSRAIAAEHLLLGLLRAGGTTTVLLDRVGAAPDDVRRRVVDLLRNAA